MSTRSNEISLFLAFCIEQYKQRHNLTGEQSMRILDQYGVLEYLEADYEPLHTQSAQWIMEDIDEFINKRKQGELTCGTAHLRVSGSISIPYRTSSHCVEIYKSKGDTTMSEITQQNLYLLLPFKVSWVADMLAEDEHISTIEAIRRVYSSAMYKQLEQESTKRWHEGPVSLYQTI